MTGEEGGGQKDSPPTLPTPAGAKVFCFFFSKKKRFLAYTSFDVTWPGWQVVDAGFRRHDGWRQPCP
jgi:hypothetical protein